MNDKARIALAEAMGRSSLLRLDGEEWSPFADANDDYAVLEWIRKGDYRDDFRERIIYDLIRPQEYQIGDYARTACAVLGIEIDEQS